MKNKILVVDDEPANLRMLDRLFRTEYDVITAASGADALCVLDLNDVAIIVSDQRMPGMTGIEFLKQAALKRAQTVRIILTGYTDVSDLVEAINSGVVYKYITKPWINTDLLQTVKRAAEFFESTKSRHLLANEKERLEIRLQATIQAFVRLLRELIALKRPDLADHSRRTANYAAFIGEEFNLPSYEMENLIFASLLHEISHVRQPTGTGLPTQSTSPDNDSEMRSSYESALAMISAVPDLQDVEIIIRYQHERFDGMGFFSGLEGETIPLGSRILAVANCFDEIHSGRDPGLICTDEEVSDWLLERAGTEFDPRVVDACLNRVLPEAWAETTNNATFAALMGRSL